MRALVIALLACASCGPGAQGPPDGGPPRALEVLDPPGAQIGLHYGQTIALRVRYRTDDAARAPLSGEAVHFSIFSDPAGSTLARDSAVTGADGVAAVVLTGGQAEAQFRVAVTAPNAPEVDFDVSVSKLDFVEVDVELAAPSATTLRALLYTDRACADLPAAQTSPAPSRSLLAAKNAARLSFVNLLSRRYALVGRAETARGLIGYGCADLPAELVPPGSISTLPLPLLPPALSPLGAFALTSSLLPAAPATMTLLGRWGLYGHCVYGAAQTLLDAMSVTGSRDPAGSDGCRPPSTRSLDRQLFDLLSAAANSPAAQLSAIADDLSSIARAATLSSRLVISAAGAAGFTGEHGLASVSFAAGAMSARYDLVAGGLPIVDVKDIALGFDGMTLTVATHGFTLGLPLFWRRALVDLSLVKRVPGLSSPPVHALVAAVIAAAQRNGKVGCAAVEDLLCSVLGGSCSYQAACTSAIDSVATWLDAPFAAPTGVDLSLSGSAAAIDGVGDLRVHELTSGVWTSTSLGASTFQGSLQ